MLFTRKIAPRRGNEHLTQDTAYGVKGMDSAPRRGNEHLTQDTAYGVKGMDSAPRRGNEHLAQGIALGRQRTHIVRPERAKALLESNAFGPTGRGSLNTRYTQGVTLGYELIGLAGRLC